MGLFSGISGKDLGDRIATSGSKYLGEGTHDVRVAGVDRNNITDNKLTIKYENDQGLETNDMFYPTETDKKTGAKVIHWKFAAAIAMLIPNTDAYDALMNELDRDNFAVLDLLVGLKGRVIMARGKGYGPPASMTDGTYEVRNTTKPDQVFFGATIEQAQQAAEAAGLKKAYINVSKYIATDGAANVEAFSAGLASLHKHPPAGRSQLGHSGVARGAGSI